MKINNSIFIIMLALLAVMVLAGQAGATSYTNDFSASTGWTCTGTNVGIANDIAYWNHSGGYATIENNMNAVKPTKWYMSADYWTYTPTLSHDLLTMHGNGVAYEYGAKFCPNTGQFYITYENAGVSALIYTKGQFEAGKKYNIGLGYESGKYTLYLDGVQIGSPVSASFTDWSNSYDIKLQATYNSNGNANWDNVYYTDEASTPPITQHDLVSFTGTNANYSTQKYAGTMTLSVWRQYGSTNQTTVQYHTVDGTARSGVDYGQTSGTLTWQTGEIYKTITVPIYNADPTNEKAFTMALVNVQDGELSSPSVANITIASSGAYLVEVVPDPVTIMNTVQATLTINDPTYQYNQIVWQLDGVVVDTFTLSGASQWQRWNGTGYANAANATVFQRSDSITSSGIHKYFVLVTYNGAQRGYAEQFFNCTSDGQGQTMIRIQAVDGSNPDSVIQTVDATAFEQENLSAPATVWTDGDHILMATMYHHYTVTLAANGYQNTTYTVYADQMAGNISSAKIVKIPMYNTQQPANASNSFVNVMVKSDVTGDPIADVVVKFTRADSTSKVKYTNSAGTLSTPFEEPKGSTITCTVSSSSYMSQTSTFTVPDEYSTLYFRLPYKPSPTPTITATPTDSGSDGSSGDGNPVLTPGQRTAKANRMLDMLSNYGEIMLYLVIIVVIISLFGKMGGK